MNKQLEESIDKLILKILNENPATVFDKYGDYIVRCDDGPAVAWKVKKEDTGKIHFDYNDRRNSTGPAWHGEIRMSSPGMEILRGRLWSKKKIASFYQSERIVAPYHKDVEKFFRDLGEDIYTYQWDFDDSSGSEGLKPWPWKSNYDAPKGIEIPPEIQKKINDLLPQFHLATGADKDKLKAELDALYKQAGIENAKEKELAAYRKASGEKYTPYEKGGDTVAGYRSKLPAIAEDKVRLYNKTLCPLLWTQDRKLVPEVRQALLQVALDFYTDTELQGKIQDVQLLGSAANYNWTPKSDLDVHILVDGSQVSMQPEEVEKYFGPSVGKWNLEHNIVIKGHPIELYIQDIHEKNAATAVYSLVKDQWVKEPSPEHISVDKQAIQKKYTMWVEKINDAIKSNDDQKLKKILEGLKEYRQAGLSENGEFSTENLVFKILRSRGHIDRLKEFITKIYDKKHSVKDGFDPTSQGPNPSDGVDQNMDNGSFYQHTNDRMRQMEEGYGAGIPETDRLKIKNDDGSIRRWQIRSKDAPKTPKMKEEVLEFLKENAGTERILANVGMNYWTLVKILRKNNNDPKKAALEATCLALTGEKPDDSKKFWINFKSIIKTLFSGEYRERTRLLYQIIEKELEDILSQKMIQKEEIDALIHESLDTVLPEIITEGELLLEHPLVKTLKKNRKPLTDEERKEVMRKGAVWHHGPKGEKTPAVWKSVVNGKTWYACNTHRAIQVKPTLKAAIKAFSFIKTTA